MQKTFDSLKDNDIEIIVLAYLVKHSDFLDSHYEKINGYLFANLENLKISGTDNSFDGRNGIFIFSSNENARLLKTNYAFPSSLAFNADSFDNTLTRFDFDTITFDDTTP